MSRSVLVRKGKSSISTGGGHGRIPEDETNGPRLPRVTRAEVAAVEDWLMGHRNVRRPLTVAAPLLALICALHAKGEYFPVRKRVAAWLRDNGHAEWTSEHPNAVDKAIQVAVALDEIEIHWAIAEGNVAAMPSILRRRYLVPNAELMDAFRNATVTFGRAKLKPDPKRSPGASVQALAALMDRKFS
jgi:hypothetical protein